VKRELSKRRGRIARSAGCAGKSRELGFSEELEKGSASALRARRHEVEIANSLSTPARQFNREQVQNTWTVRLPAWISKQTH
jgi:hypothetical protein